MFRPIVLPPEFLSQITCNASIAHSSLPKQKKKESLPREHFHALLGIARREQENRNRNYLHGSPAATRLVRCACENSLALTTQNQPVDLRVDTCRGGPEDIMPRVSDSRKQNEQTTFAIFRHI